MRGIRVHGQSGRYRHTRVGVGGRMDSIQCAVVLAKLERFDWETRQRIELGAHYDALLNAAGVKTITIRPDRTSVHGQYTVRVAERARVEKTLKASGIPTAVHYPLSLHQQPAYSAGYEGRSFPISERLAREVLSLPMHAYLDEATQQRIVGAVRDATRAAATAA
jgi:UDP-2-acetamido-2-deoxy-ribo-hexuluronate aminotransferase